MAGKVGKTKVTGKVLKNSNKKEFTVQKNKPREEDVTLVFSIDDRQVEKLDTDDLYTLSFNPPSIKKAFTNVVWLNNFQVSGLASGETYIVRMPKITGWRDVIWFDGTTVQYIEYSEVDANGNANKEGGFAQFSLNTGDPGSGWTTT